MNTAKIGLALSFTLLVITACTAERTDNDNPLTQSKPEKEQIKQIKPGTPNEENSIVKTPLAEVSLSKGSADFSKHANVGLALQARYHTEVVPFPPRRESSIIQPNKDNYLPTPSNGVFLTSQAPLSTFSVDVDTGSYANVRSYLQLGNKPHPDAIREEAFINYFDYNYPAPENKDQPFSIFTELAPAPWHKDRKLMRITLKGYDVPVTERKPSNLVFLIDVSGSMNESNKLPLLIKSLSLLVNQLSDKDTVSLITYASSTKLLLKPTPASEKSVILDALKGLKAGGATNGEGGIQLAYQQALNAKIEKGVNRVVLATDGDFNVGTTNIDELKAIIKEKRKQGIALTTLGFGRGNYNDAVMEQLANIGDGNHAYIDTLHEAKKVLSRQLSGTVQHIASDVKVQVEFNPDAVKEYRLIGYTNRKLRDEDFKNDAVDAGDIGAGHTVTALYELTLAGAEGQIDELRYAKSNKVNNPSELLEVKVRYKLPGSEVSKMVKRQVKQSTVLNDFDKASEDFRFAAAVAAFAQKLKDNRYLTGMSYPEIAEIARKSRGNDPFNYRGEFVSLVEIAPSL
ncbi:vWA domain-containing protein [Veronia pacifica]|nr:VWA domain-containing protein [Veronia pacifica]